MCTNQIIIDNVQVTAWPPAPIAISDDFTAHNPEWLRDFIVTQTARGPEGCLISIDALDFMLGWIKERMHASEQEIAL
jgi:hypothetical protein